MEGLLFLGFVLAVMFLVGLIGLISGKENKKFFLTIMLIPIIIVVIGFGTCVAMLS
ncbi:hypothetical protein AB9T89_13115 [Flavobacterium oncorhynchi]|uniref:hypothetical protein n=1 Tax=Flavobacterium oncorhynchi TaxID=728056 RepID=UPI00351A9A00